jgi:hypothetical protein
MYKNIICVDRLIYMSLAACNEGFRQACRPMIGVDGYFLKGPLWWLLEESQMTKFIPSQLLLLRLKLRTIGTSF